MKYNERRECCFENLAEKDENGGAAGNKSWKKI